MKYLFDTMALLALFNDENGADTIQHLLEQEKDIFVSAITLTELYYLYAQRRGRKIAQERVAQVRYNLKVISLGEEESIQAGKYKLKKIPIADAVIAAAAESIGATVVTDDPHFEKTNIPIKQFRRRHKNTSK